VTNPNGPVVILGASYAGGWTVSEFIGVPVVNKGITGQQSFELLNRFEQDVVPAHPRAVIIWGFINDIFRTPRDRVDAAMTRAKESFAQLIARSRAAGIEPVLVTEITIRQPKSVLSEMRSLVGGWFGRPSYPRYVNGHVLAMNAWLRDLARREGLLLLDAQPILSAPNGPRLREYAADDGSHVSAAGYEALTRYVTPLLEASLRAR
jgi:lysophospholipase L1-like esterase